MATNLEQLRTAYPNLTDDQIADLAAVSLKLSGSQKTRKGFLKIMKEAEPERVIPELDEPARFEAELAKRDAEIQALKDGREQERFERDLAAQKNEARTKFNLTDEDVTKMEDMMKKGELPADYRFAPALFNQQKESSTPTNYGTGGFGPFDINGQLKEQPLSGLMDDPDTWAQKQAHSMIEDFARNRNRSTF